MWEKKKVYVVMVFLKEEDDEGKPLNWSFPYEEYFADTIEEAERMKEKFMSGQNEDYGDLIEDCWISDEKEEREFWNPGVAEKQRSSILQKLSDNKKQIADKDVPAIPETSEKTASQNERQRSETR